MFLQKTRERLETIREVAKHERALAKANRIALAAAAQANDGQSTDDTTELGDLVIDSDEDDEPIAVLTENANNDDIDASVPRQYYATLLSSVGLQRAMTAQNIESTQQTATEPSLIAAYVFNPLLDFWQTARNNFNLNYLRRDVTDGDGDDGDDGNDSNMPNETNGWLTATDDDDVVENNDREIAYNPLDNGLNGSIVDDDNGAASEGAIAVVDSSDIVAGNANSANHSLPFKLNVNSARMKENAKESSRFERALLAFQNAFYKYAGGMMTTTTTTSSPPPPPPLTITTMLSSRRELNNNANVNSKTDASVQQPEYGKVGRALEAIEQKQSEQTIHDEAVDMSLDAATALPLTAIHLAEVDFVHNANGTNLNGNDNGNSNATAATAAPTIPASKSTARSVLISTTMGTTTESPNIQIIPSHQMLTQQQQQQNGVSGGPGAAESAGIYVLEFVGQIVGLSWGAFSQIQNWFHKK